MGDCIYTVKTGDCMASIAADRGYTWQFLWGLPQNRSLKTLRKNPNVLMEGDEVFIPDKRVKDLPCATDQRHKFVRKGVFTKFRIRLMAYGRPRTEVRYVLNAGTKSYQGKPDGDGYIEAAIPTGLKSAQLVIFDKGIAESYNVRLADLDPVEEIRGIQQRLLNLGLACSVTGQEDDQTKAALRMFQQQRNLAGDGALTDETRQALRSAHGA